MKSNKNDQNLVRVETNNIDSKDNAHSIQSFVFQSVYQTERFIENLTQEFTKISYKDNCCITKKENK